MPNISVALGLLKKPIDAVLAIAAGKAKDALAELKAEARIKSVYQRLNSTQKVKTIWDVDRARSISSFYYPAKVKSSNGTSQLLSSLDELPDNAVILSGTVGQGKSILLRYLLGKEIRSGSRIPLFVELRKVPPAGLETYLRELFAELLEINGHPEIFELFLKTGRVSVLLDGFDEIDPVRTQDIMLAIERLVQRAPEARVIVTSRPASGIETSPLFSVIHIAPLSEGDFRGFFYKILSRDHPLAESITQAIIKSNSVRAVASTPLLATLLTIVYRSTQRIPADFSEFYDQLFQILLVRHDRSKAYARRRKTTLNDREIQQAFEAFCFKIQASGHSVIPKMKALEISRQSIQARELICREDDFLDDVTRVTCLLQEEGGDIEFVHQSVREFFAAKYIESRPDEIAQSFYERLSINGNWKKWEQVVTFLSQIDKYRASRLYSIPVGHTFLKSVHSDTSVAAPPRLRALISDLGGVKRSKRAGANSKQSQFVVYRSYPDDNYHWDFIAASMFTGFFGSGGIGNGAKRWIEAFTNPEVQSLTFTEVAEFCGRGRALDSYLSELVVSIRNDVSALVASAKIVDASSQFMEL